MNCNCQNNGAYQTSSCGCVSDNACGCAAASAASDCSCGCGCNCGSCNNCCNCGCCIPCCNCGCNCNCNCNGCNSSCNNLYRCNCLKKYIAQLTQKINEYSCYLEANPCDKLAACLVCEAKRELAAVKEVYCRECLSHDTGGICSDDCGCNSGCDCDNSCGCNCGCNCN